MTYILDRIGTPEPVRVNRSQMR